MANGMYTAAKEELAATKAELKKTQAELQILYSKWYDLDDFRKNMGDALGLGEDAKIRDIEKIIYDRKNQEYLAATKNVKVKKAKAKPKEKTASKSRGFIGFFRGGRTA
ncbi:MAG: hypothetical protein LBB23_03795 [Rickettsiales bacterium]|jgi:hypothetical protein|nr:hypothetical protein [Rickettsiales bacterium]